MYLDLSQCISDVSAKLNDDRARMSSKYGYQILAESIHIFHIFTRSSYEFRYMITRLYFNQIIKMAEE